MQYRAGIIFSPYLFDYDTCKDKRTPNYFSNNLYQSTTKVEEKLMQYIDSQIRIQGTHFAKSNTIGWSPSPLSNLNPRTNVSQFKLCGLVSSDQQQH